MICGKNRQEISVFEEFFIFYTNQFCLKMMKTDSILSGAYTKREVSSLKKLAFSKEKEGNQVLFIFKLYMTA